MARPGLPHPRVGPSVSNYSIAEIIAKQSRGCDPDSDRVALVVDGVSTTYAELEDRAERLAVGLARAGFEHGDRLCVLMHNRVEWLEVFFAAARLGGVLVPVNHLLTSREIHFLVTDSGASWFLAEDALWERAAELMNLADNLTWISVGPAQSGATAYESLLAGERFSTRPRVEIGDLFLIQYTSGTTGTPKGAMHTHSTVMWNAISQKGHFGLDRDTVYLCLPALSWVAGFHSLTLQTLWSGGIVVLDRTDLPFDPSRICTAVACHRVTHVALVPTVMRRLLAFEGLPDSDLSSLRIAITGGESVPVQLMEQLNLRLPSLSVVQVYGMSEFPSLVTLLEPADARAKLGSAGKANIVSHIRVVDRAERDCAPGEVGEILTRSPATMIGYYGQPEATLAVLGDGWLHTGDLGYLDDEGFLFIRGRSKDLIISGGMNIYPAEVEQAVMRHPAVAEAAVFGAPDERWGEIVTAVVVLKPGETATEKELRASLVDQLARFKIPKLWEVRSEPPLSRTSSGKVQKHKLR